MAHIKLKSVLLDGMFKTEVFPYNKEKYYALFWCPKCEEYPAEWLSYEFDNYHSAYKILTILCDCCKSTGFVSTDPAGITFISDYHLKNVYQE